MADIDVARLAALLQQTGKHHHQAYLETDGGDPEWALWYAGYLQAHLSGLVEPIPARQLLVKLLLDAEAAHVAAGMPTAWPDAYARHLADALR